MTYDQDYYARGEGHYRLNPVFQPLLNLLYAWRVRVTLNRLGRPEPGRALDVGAGRGEFLHFLKRRGWQVAGTQVSREAIAAAKEVYGLDLVYTQVPHSAELGKFDLITYWHVFEHLENPEVHLHEIVALLRDEHSTLVIEVPNPESLGAGMCRLSWLGSDVKHHVNMRTRTQLKNMLTSAGLEVFRMDRFSSKFSLIYVASALYGWLTRGWLDFDFLMDVLKRPLGTAIRQPLRTLILMLTTPFALVACVPLAVLGILLDQPETLRLYARLRSPSGTSIKVN